MNYKIAIVLIIFVFLSCSRKHNAVVINSLDKFTQSNRLQHKLDSVYLAHPESIGIMVHMEYPNKNISWSGASGYSNKYEKTKNKPDQPILIASNTKTFVASSILRLEEENKLDVEASIGKYLSGETISVLESAGYDIKAIKLIHLLSHTSGINDYVDSPKFINKINSEPSYRWSRKEQIDLGVLGMKIIGKAGEIYKYSDTNYLLLCEIIEEVTQMKYYQAIRELIDFNKLDLDQTWFESLETPPKNSRPLAHQYVDEWGLDTYDLDKSFDLYGGGGLASTSKNLALFLYKLFNNEVFIQPETLDKLLTKVETTESSNSDYRFGIWQSALIGKTVYGHGGFWGSMVYYLPELNTAISIFILEKDKDNLRKKIAEVMITELIK